MLQLVQDHFLRLQQELVVALHLLGRVDHERARDVRAVRLVARTQHADDDAELQRQLVTVKGEVYICDSLTWIDEYYEVRSTTHLTTLYLSAYCPPL